jgi:hypothetical protein
MVRDFDLLDDKGDVLLEIRNNHSARVESAFEQKHTTKKLHLRVHATHGTPAAVFRVRVFA